MAIRIGNSSQNSDNALTTNSITTQNDSSKSDLVSSLEKLLQHYGDEYEKILSRAEEISKIIENIKGEIEFLKEQDKRK